MYELACLEEGRLVRGGVKAPLLTVGKWLRENVEHDPAHADAWVIVPASPDAVTKDELYDWLDKHFKEA